MIYAVVLALAIFLIGARLGHDHAWRERWVIKGRAADILAADLGLRREPGESDRRLGRRIRAALKQQPPAMQSLLALRQRSRC